MHDSPCNHHLHMSPQLLITQQSLTAILFQTVLCYSELTKQLCVKHSEPKLVLLHKQPLPFLTDLLICWVLKFHETALITLVITSHTVFWSSLYTYNYKPKKKAWAYGTRTQFPLPPASPSEEGSDNDHKLQIRMFWLGIRKNVSTRAQWKRLSEWEGTWCLKSVFLHITVLFSLESDCFWTEPLEKQKAFVAATLISTLL